MCVCERKGLCYLSGTVISWALLSWLDPAPAVLSTQWMISCSPLEGKSWFFSLHSLHIHLSLLFSCFANFLLNIFNILSLPTFFATSYLFSHFSSLLLCPSLFSTLTSNSFEQPLLIPSIPPYICSVTKARCVTRVDVWVHLDIVCKSSRKM